MSKSSSILVTAASIFVVAAFWVSNSQVQNSKSNLQKDATRVTEGVMSAKQIEHSKLYTQSNRRKKLSTTQDGTTLVVGLPWSDEREKNKLDFDDYLRETTCKAVSIVLGTVKSKASQLTTDGTFIFTDYELTVNDVLKNNPNFHIEPNTEITITRPGGVIDLNGKIISVKDRSFKPLEANKSYLLFLSFIPSTGAYRSLDSESNFEISKNRLLRLTDEAPTYRAIKQEDEASAIDNVRSFVNTCNRREVGK
ncbi:MAG: hypothetical protein ACXW3C_00820 [Pyrinomonadaceae bacterium]